jgi:hypothetical protein
MKRDINVKKMSNKLDKRIKKRRDKLLEIVKEKGWWGVDKEGLAKELNCSTQTLFRDYYDWILKQNLMPSVAEVEINLFKGLKSSADHCNYVVDHKDEYSERDVQGAAKILVLLGEKMTRFLEDYNRKAKVADKIDVTGAPLSQENLKKIYEDLQNGTDKRGSVDTGSTNDDGNSDTRA